MSARMVKLARRCRTAELRRLLVATLLISGWRTALAQEIHIPIRVHLSVSDSSGVLESSFRAALRALPDVQLVLANEKTEYELGIVAQSVYWNGPAGTIIYYGSISLSEPISAAAIRIASNTGDVSLTMTHPRPELSNRPGAIAFVAADTLGTLLRKSGYEMHLATWTFFWNAGELENRAKRFVSRLDSRCFERSRMFDRKYSLVDSVALRAADKEIDSRQWDC